MKTDDSEARANVSVSQHFVTLRMGNQRYEILLQRGTRPEDFALPEAEGVNFLLLASCSQERRDGRRGVSTLVSIMFV